MANLQNLKHIILVLISVAYSIYATSAYLAVLFGLVPAYIIASVLSILAHAYLSESSFLLAKRELSVTHIITVLLISVIVFSDIKGVHENVNIGVKSEFSESIKKKELELDNQRQKLNELTVKNATWIMRSNANKVKEQITLLTTELKEVKQERQKELNSRSSDINVFKGVSIILLILSSLATYVIESKSDSKAHQGVNNPINPIAFKNIKSVLTPSPIGFKSNNPESINDTDFKAYLNKYKHVLPDIDYGLTINELSEKHNISRSTVQNIKRCLKSV